MRYISRKLSSNSIKERVIFSLVLLLVLFFGFTVVSYFTLPEEFLKNRNPLQNWETSSNTLVLLLQIFFYNMLSVLVITFGSLFGKKKESELNYLSVGYLVLFTQISINGIVLGTWSFSMGGTSIPLMNRINRTFDIVHRAGLWEMIGQLLITCALARIAIVLTSGKETKTRKIQEINLTKAEKFTLTSGFILMLVGAVIESVAINML
ncbi:hypothetical protein acsn021_07520 [Anaerocolumna cellulosilytica]|uniref:Uncharacterized protein n=1 Tax=Anaerocolumna cellulosilytica TaxID=433286 RepID=A0A6S6QP90_9FIRM|nr:hypothetical protein [Anaerocolumna cellulosilytica]MBB5197872.1 hypothetical protein [Anaerocolumna cellulosilytica]BCJ93183.1 hypothetical protein acsn021_07520 [Anaerocolumna cellulosilytica]